MSYSFDTHTNISDPEAALEVLIGLAGVFIAIGLLTAAVCITFYLLRAIGVYKIAKRLKLTAPWLAFIPIANNYTLGKIAEAQVDEKKPLPYGVLLLIFRIASELIGYLIGFRVASFLINFIGRLIETEGNINEDEFVASFISLIASAVIISVIAFFVSVAYAVFYYIAHYKIYKLLTPQNAVALLILTILVSASEPIILFCLRNKQPIAPVAAAQPQIAPPESTDTPPEGNGN